MYFGARSQNARQSILLIKEMIFDYLIDILAQKAEILEKLKIAQISKIENLTKKYTFWRIFEI